MRFGLLPLVCLFAAILSENELDNRGRPFEGMSPTGRSSFLPNVNGLMGLVKMLQALWLCDRT